MRTVTLPHAEPAPRQPALVARVMGILINPDAEWQRIDREPASVGSLFMGYILILAAIGPIAHMLGGLVFGYGFFVKVHPSLMWALEGAIVTYVLTIVGAFISMLVVDFLAPSFKGQRNQIQALKLVAYGWTAAWVAGIFGLIPALGILGLLGLYSLYLFYRGVPVMMKTPPDRAMAYTIVVVIVNIVIFILIGFMTSLVIGPGELMGAMTRGASLQGSGDTGDSSGTKLSFPGGQIDLGQLQQAAKNIENAAKNLPTPVPGAAGGGTQPGQPAQPGQSAQPGVPTNSLKALLPDTLPNGMPRTKFSAGSGQVAGFGGTGVEARYGTDANGITLNVVDMGTMGAFAAMGTALGISANTEDENGYTKMGKVDGNTAIEEFDRKAQTAKYTIIIGSRFLIHAEGSSVTMDQVKAAAATIDLGKLAALLK